MKIEITRMGDNGYVVTLDEKKQNVYSDVDHELMCRHILKHLLDTEISDDFTVDNNGGIAQWTITCEVEKRTADAAVPVRPVIDKE